MRPNCLALIAAAFLPTSSIAKPFASPDSLTAFEDSELVTTVSILDNDTSGGPDLTAALLTPPAHGILTLSNNGTLTYIPNPNFHGSDEFSYIAQETDDRPVTFIVDQARSQVEFTATVNDPDLGSRTDTDTSAISGTAVLQLDPARPPLDDVQITDFEFTLADGADLSFNYGFFIGSLNVDIADNGLTIAMENPGSRSSVDTENKFSQSDNDVRITGATEISASGTIGLIFEDTTLDVDAVESVDITDAQVVELDGTLTVTLPINFVSTLPVDDTRTVDVTLSGQVVATATVPPLPVDSEPATVTITVAPTNDGPLAIHDTFTTPVGQTLTRGTATGLLANDIDIDLDTLTASLETPPVNGTVSVNLDGSFTYSPNPGFSGEDSFTYSVSDSTPLTSVPILTAGSNWRFLDDGSDQGITWYAKDFDDSTWSTGPAQLGYGDPGQATSIDFGGDPDNRFITTYFRGTFFITDPEKIVALEAGILRDDAAAVYVNGVEVYRDAGLAPAAPFDAPATISAGGSVENTFFPFFVASDLLVPGENSIAVEVHQSSGSSSDVSFDLAISATLPTPSPLVVAGSDWRYLDDGSDQMAAWRDPSFDDTQWNSGPARLGYGEDEIVTTVDFGGESANKFPTTYFRHDFEISNASSVQAAQIKLLADDGAAVFLNGTEVARHNLDADAAFDTLANATTGSLDEHRFTLFVVDPALLMTGANTLAVEIHQSSPRSSDLAFDLELLAAFAPALATVSVEVTGDPGQDSDNDGMLDDYELAFGLTVGIDDSALDPDADGRTNLQESVAGTNPFDASSSLSISATTFDGSTLGISFQSVPGKSYRLQSSIDLTTWTEVPGSTLIAETSQSTLSYAAPDGQPTTSIRVVTP